MNLGESWPTGCRSWQSVCPSSATSPSSGQVAGRIFNGLADPNKAKGHWQKKKNLNGVCDFWSSGACCRCSYAIHKSCTLIKGHTQARRRRISLCVGVHCRNCCRCCGSPMWLIVCQKDCPFKIAIRRACWQVILARPSSSSPAACVAGRTRVTARPTNEAARPVAIVAQLSTSHQCNLQLHFCKFASSTRRWQRQRQRDTSCPSNLNIKQLKSCSCVCNAILFDLFEKQNRKIE